MPNIGLLHDHHAGIIAQCPGQLGASDIQRVDPAVSLRNKQSVKPPVEAPTSSATRPAGLSANSCNAFSNFRPPRLTYFSSSGVSARRHSLSSGTSVPGLSSIFSPKKTCPAIISARARSRLGASPRRTNATSRRSLFTAIVISSLLPVTRRSALRVGDSTQATRQRRPDQHCRPVAPGQYGCSPYLRAWCVPAPLSGLAP